MPYSALQLITSAYFKSGVLGRDLQTLSGSQAADGLESFNDLLADQAVNLKLIPFYKEFQLTAVVGQEKYFIPNCVQIQSFTFNIGPVRYSSDELSRNEFFATGRVDNIQSLPFTWHQERVLDGTDLYLYFDPSQQFILKLWCKFALGPYALFDDLSLTLERSFRSYEKYALANRICADFNINMSPTNLEIFKSLEQSFQYLSPPDVKVTKLSSLGGQPFLNWGDVNIGRGWRP